MVKQIDGILACIRNRVVSRTREVVIPLYLALVRQHLECCVQFGGSHYKRNWALEHALGKTAKMVKIWSINYEGKLRDCSV